MDKKKKGVVGRDASIDYKILQELKRINATLKEIRDILDNTWRGRSPQ